ncbi:MAG: CotH kinase family protein [Bacteroidaceae bacterium]|nr:CotH kinase family protein [Bacteroidaceae bacterium]
MKKHVIYLSIFLLSALMTACSDDSSSLPPVTPETPSTPLPEATVKNGSLDGKIIGTKWAVDYDNNNAKSDRVNTIGNVFDGDYTTYFASYDRSGTWVGLDLGEKHVINKIAYSPRIGQRKRVQLAIIEGANQSDFSDAIPIHLIKDEGVENQMTYAEVHCSRGFRYVRYVSPSDVRCNLAELAFYGEKGEGDDSQFYQITNLPTVVINTEGAEEVTSKEDELSSVVYIISEEGKKLLATKDTGVRGRGNASWGFPKKPYRLKFDEKQQLLDAPAKAKKWTLINNYGDKTLMRNILAFELSKRLGLAYTPYCQPVDVVLNGEYRGCYQLCDQIEVNKNRVNITEMEPEDVALPELSGGYLIEVDAYASSEASHFYSTLGTPVTIKSPDDEDIVSAQTRYITDYFNKMENAVFASNFDDPETGYRQYLDLDSFLKHFLVGEMSGNTDTYWSVYMTKDRDSDKFFTGPVWDFDIAFDNDQRTYPIAAHTDYIFATKGSVASEAMRDLVSRIVKDDKGASQRLSELWSEARTTKGLDETSLLEFVDKTAELLNESQKLNFLRWNILSDRVHENPQASGSYEGEVAIVKNFIRKRLPQMDGFIGR